MALRLLENRDGLLRIAHDGAFGEFYLQVARVQARHHRARVRMLSTSPLSRNCEAERFTDTRSGGTPAILPRARLTAGLADHPAADGADQAAFLRERNEIGRRNRCRGQGASSGSSASALRTSPVRVSTFGW